ncbi:MAG: hypothetical protein AAF829_09240 [Pseudomonadota bacterium]
MEALRDPFSKVHPFFWPVLWLSLRAFLRWTGRMIEEGHAFAGIRVELTWYGTIHVRAIDLSEERAAFNRLMMGVMREDRWGVLADAAGRVDALILSAEPSHCLGLLRLKLTPRINLPAAQTTSEAFAGVCGTNRYLPEGTDPPLAAAPLPRSGRGAALAFARIFRSTARPGRCGRGSWLRLISPLSHSMGQGRT